MRDATPEPRTAVMILVEASWEDQSGTLRRERARMENTSNSGACIRVKKPIDVGAKLRVQWRWEEFSGVAREGADFAWELLSMEDIYRAAGIVGQGLQHQQSGGNAAPRTHSGIVERNEASLGTDDVGCGGSEHRRSGARREGAARGNRDLSGRAEKIVRGAMGSEGGRKPSDTGRAGDSEGALHGARTAQPGWCSPGKTTFGNWLTMKQQEAQRMAEAVELCAKAPGADASSGSAAEVSLIDASAKPV